MKQCVLVCAGASAGADQSRQKANHKPRDEPKRPRRHEPTVIYMSPKGNTPQPIQNSPHWGQILTPKNGLTPPICRIWCADNQAYTSRFNWTRYYTWLAAMRPHRHTCAFAAAPDVIANAAATLDRFRYFGWRIKALGFKVALVAQDGMEALPWPPAHTFDCLFIGGSTAWKMSDAAAECIRRALSLGKWIHVGRVNSQLRIRHFRRLGAHSADGTYLAFNPREGYQRLNKALTEELCQPELWSSPA